MQARQMVCPHAAGPADQSGTAAECGRPREIATMIELPPPSTLRWVARRKAAVVAAVSSGIITVEEACRRYHMSEAELLAWQRAFERDGILGLRASRVQRYRGAGRSRPADPPTDHITPAQYENISAKT